MIARKAMSGMRGHPGNEWERRGEAAPDIPAPTSNLPHRARPSALAHP